MTRKESDMVKDECYKVMKKLVETRDIFKAVLEMNNVFNKIDTMVSESEINND